MRESEQKMADIAGVKYVEKDPEPIVRRKTIMQVFGMEVLMDEVRLKRTFKSGILKCKAQKSLFDRISLT